MKAAKKKKKKGGQARETWSTCRPGVPQPSGRLVYLRWPGRSAPLALHCRLLPSHPPASGSKGQGQAVPFLYLILVVLGPPAPARRGCLSLSAKIQRMPSRAMNRLFVESAAEAPVLCAPRPRRAQVHPCSADLILGPPPFLLNNKSSKEGGRTKPVEEEDEDSGWALFGGSPPERADNPLVHDPHFLLNQRSHPTAADPTPLELGFFDHRSRTSVHRPTYSSSNSNNSNNSSFAPSSFAPAVRIQGFDVAPCRGSHSNDNNHRVLSARA